MSRRSLDRAIDRTLNRLGRGPIDRTLNGLFRLRLGTLDRVLRTRRLGWRTLIRWTTIRWTHDNPPGARPMTVVVVVEIPVGDARDDDRLVAHRRRAHDGAFGISVVAIHA